MASLMHIAVWLLAAVASSAGQTNRSDNCFSLLPEDEWPHVLHHNTTSASLLLSTSEAGPQFSECLQEQLRTEEELRRRGRPTGTLYRMALLRNETGEDEEEALLSVDAAPSQLLKSVRFEYLVYSGQYRVRFTLCDAETNTCRPELNVMSGVVAEVDSDLITCDDDGSGKDEETSKWNYSVAVHPSSATFTLTFVSCTSLPLPYEKARVQLWASAENVTDCGGGDGDNTTFLVDERKVRVKSEQSHSSLTYVTPELAGNDLFYCVLVSQNDHVVCGANTSSLPHVCSMSSAWVLVETRPLIARIIPYCSSHFRCGWLYLVVVGSAVLLLSCALALCLVRCSCDRRRSVAKRHGFSDRDVNMPLEGICLNEANSSFRQRKTWLQLHEEWDHEPPKNPGKILLLYSPDSPSFKELQTAFKSFLELACHCIVLDLFDEELFRAIAFDPELWLSNLLQDPDFKVVVVCSEGAFKRHQALLSGEVLNIPDNSSLDGLFSAGLRFITAQHANDAQRMALARYEMLPLTAPEFRLSNLDNRQFAVPTQLHDLFCWIHGYDPLDLMGKPWDRYHLELQLLQDALKKARLGPRSQPYHIRT